MSKVTMPSPEFPGVIVKGHKAIPRYLFTAGQMEAYAAAKVREALEWQPIETAPRDGTWVRLWREPETIGNASPEIIAVYNAPTEYMSDGVWMWPTDMYDPYAERGRLLALDEIKNGDFYEDDSFTHWMPLPPPPQHDNQ